MPLAGLIFAVALRVALAASGTAFMATLNAPKRTVVEFPEWVTLNVEPFPV